MQFAKDSFYMALRNRLSALNPARTCEVDGEVRPAIVVVENEAPALSTGMSDVFYVRWGALSGAGEKGPGALECTVEYSTAGTAEAGSLGRGRALAALDCELLRICQPASGAKCDFTQLASTELGTHIFWSAPRLGALEVRGQTLWRQAALTVFYFAEVEGR
ncbi:MAG TPA: hypothetical protein VN622_02505 [Clostridia bacterium]|nr:hypothetical protein [Clostridia bacterium]